MKIQGRERLKRKLARIPKVARVEMRKALEQSAAEIAATARNFAPARTGALKRSIDYTFGEYKPDNANVRGVGGGDVGDPDLTVAIHAGDKDAWYARFVEFGTAPHAQPNNPRVGYSHPGATARPFFLPAWRLVRKRARTRISRATLKAARAVAGNGK